MNVYDSDGFIESLVGANNSFLGVQSTTDITRIELRSSTDGFNFLFDDVRFESAASTVPVPAAVWLFGSGLLGLIGVAKRKKA